MVFYAPTLLFCLLISWDSLSDTRQRFGMSRSVIISADLPLGRRPVPETQASRRWPEPCRGAVAKEKGRAAPPVPRTPNGVRKVLVVLEYVVCAKFRSGCCCPKVV